MTLITGPEALQDVQAAAREYVEAKRVVEQKHEALKQAIRTAADDANQTQEKIAEATAVVDLAHAQGDYEPITFKLSRQRVSQIIHE